ncbi:MAG: hypothetical protein M1503_05650 [Thaumarchaeota archaeon]|nr:hypothetical protein [Nitrososphaerota archaeon]
MRTMASRASRIKISRKNYDRLIEARSEMGLKTFEETLDAVLEFWFTWMDHMKVIELEA